MTFRSIEKIGLPATLLGVAPILIGVFALPLEAQEVSIQRERAGQSVPASLATARTQGHKQTLTGSSNTGANKGTIRRRCGPGGKYTCTLKTR